MASTINASTSAGLVTTADTSGVLVLQSNGTTAQTISGTATTMAGDATINGLTVGKGAGAVGTNTAVGGSALASSNTGTLNTGLGQSALNQNTSGANNTAVGGFCLNFNTTGSNNTAVGAGLLGSYFGALGLNTTGSNNTAMGQQALYSNTTASNNTAVGYQAGYANTTGEEHTAIGWKALDACTTGTQNTSIGSSAHNLVTTGSRNVAIGKNSGNILTTGSDNIHIGLNAIASSSGVNYEMVIGSSGAVDIVGKGSNTGFINNNSGGTYQGNNAATWSVTSDQRLKKNIVDNTVGLDAITSIRVRNFEYRLPEEVTELDSQNAIQKNGIQLGAIAQELQTVLPDCVKTESTGVLAVETDNLIWYMVNAIKELKAEIETLKGTK